MVNTVNISGLNFGKRGDRKDKKFGQNGVLHERVGNREINHRRSGRPECRTAAKSSAD